MTAATAGNESEKAELHPLERYRPIPRAALTVLVAVVVGLALALLTNGLPAAEAAKRMTARAYMPHLTVSYPTSGRDQITVVTLDDLDLAHLGLTWPVPMDYYQRLVDRLLTLKPKALFIDIVFLDDRPPELVARFAMAACAATEAGVPVYLASLQEQGHGSRTMIQLAAARNAQGHPCLRMVAPNLMNDRFDHSLWEYPLQVEPAGGGEPVRSAALAMACDLDKSSCPPTREQSMALLWPARGDSLNPDLHLQDNGRAGLQSTCVSQLPMIDYVPLVPGFLRDLLRGGPKPKLCPYHKEVPVRALSGLGLSAAEREAVISGKIVLMGTAFQSHGDRVESPLEQNLAGVHSHAIALDNLLSLQGEYRRSGDFSLRDVGSPASLFTLCAVALIALGSVAWHLWPWGRPVPVDSLKPVGKTVFLEEGLKSLAISKKPWLIRTCIVSVRLLVLALLRILSLWRWPGHGFVNESFPWKVLIRGVLAVALAFLGIGAIFILGDRIFRVGPLSVIEYVLFPLGVDFLDRGQALARHFAVLLHASAANDPVTALRRWLDKRGA